MKKNTLNTILVGAGIAAVVGTGIGASVHQVAYNAHLVKVKTEQARQAKEKEITFSISTESYQFKNCMEQLPNTRNCYDRDGWKHSTNDPGEIYKICDRFLWDVHFQIDNAKKQGIPTEGKMGTEVEKLIKEVSKACVENDLTDTFLSKYNKFCHGDPETCISLEGKSKTAQLAILGNEGNFPWTFDDRRKKITKANLEYGIEHLREATFGKDYRNVRVAQNR